MEYILVNRFFMRDSFLGILGKAKIAEHKVNLLTTAGLTMLEHLVFPHTILIKNKLK